MKMTVTNTYEVSFSVQEFTNQEGGMGHRVFGKECATLEEALTVLDLAVIHDPKGEWVIVCDVARGFHKGEPKEIRR